MIDELERAIKYIPNFQEKFQLEKFTPQQATDIFQVIADQHELQIDKDYMTKICRNELINKEGTISPVDIQVLARIVNGYPNGRHRGFNKNLFSKKGGIKGLLANFVKKTIESLGNQSKQKLAIKVLLILIDTEQSLRAGLLTKQQISECLDQVTMDELSAILDLLEERRLVNSITEEGDGSDLMSEKQYEIAHEKLIKGVQDMAEEHIPDYTPVNLLLNRKITAPKFLLITFSHFRLSNVIEVARSA
jgi:hypothetical protein